MMDHRSPGVSTRNEGRRVWSDSRGVSVAVGYVLGLTISALILSVLLYGVGGFVEDQREQVVREELTVVGQQLAGELTATDRLVQGSGPETSVRIVVRLPAQVANTKYTVGIQDDGTASQLVLRTDDPPVSVVVGLDTTTDVSTGTVSGGRLVIEYDAAGSGDLEVVDAA